MSAFRKSTTPEPLPMAAFDSDRRMYVDMVEGSKQLLHALQTGRGPRGFLWGPGNSSSSWRPTDVTTQFHYRITMIQEREEFADTLRVARDPCTRCGTRADIGCRHRRVA